ncbi:metallophosphoesterase family protein [Salinithrix halophila]|uniref:Phosphoesterase n=1 Tax=Salinithrix halophila TaxID=1485204 RepID=A0ABV8JKV4_9BACL
MRILIISDSHGEARLLREIVDRVNADHVIHCGDFTTDRNELPNVPMTVVRGNCDWEEVPEEDLWQVGQARFFVTHGHRYQVKSTLLPMRYRAEEAGAQIACFGHSHFPVCEQDGPILLINPGSISSPRGYPVPTYAVLETGEENRAEVAFYTTQGTPVHDRGGTFRWGE